MSVSFEKLFVQTIINKMVNIFKFNFLSRSYIVSTFNNSKPSSKHIHENENENGTKKFTNIPSNRRREKVFFSLQIFFETSFHTSLTLDAASFIHLNKKLALNYKSWIHEAWIKVELKVLKKKIITKFLRQRRSFHIRLTRRVVKLKLFKSDLQTAKQNSVEFTNSVW